MNRNLYLHETVDVIGQGQYDTWSALAGPVLRMPEMFAYKAPSTSAPLVAVDGRRSSTSGTSERMVGKVGPQTSTG